jgi:hypothetical protein
MPFWKSKPSLVELEEETEHLEAENKKTSVELSVAQKREAIARLKERGLSPKNFSFDFRRILNWLKTH